MNQVENRIYSVLWLLRKEDDGHEFKSSLVDVAIIPCTNSEQLLT